MGEISRGELVVADRVHSIYDLTVPAVNDAEDLARRMQADEQYGSSPDLIVHQAQLGATFRRDVLGEGLGRRDRFTDGEFNQAVGRRQVAEERRTVLYKKAAGCLIYALEHPSREPSVRDRGPFNFVEEVASFARQYGQQRPIVDTMAQLLTARGVNPDRINGITNNGPNNDAIRRVLVGLADDPRHETTVGKYMLQRAIERDNIVKKYEFSDTFIEAKDLLKGVIIGNRFRSLGIKTGILTDAFRRADSAGLAMPDFLVDAEDGRREFFSASGDYDPDAHKVHIYFDHAANGSFRLLRNTKKTVVHELFHAASASSVDRRTRKVGRIGLYSSITGLEPNEGFTEREARLAVDGRLTYRGHGYDEYVLAMDDLVRTDPRSYTTLAHSYFGALPWDFPHAMGQFYSRLRPHQRGVY